MLPGRFLRILLLGDAEGVAAQTLLNPAKLRLALCSSVRAFLLEMELMLGLLTRALESHGHEDETAISTVVIFTLHHKEE